MLAAWGMGFRVRTVWYHHASFSPWGVVLLASPPSCSSIASVSSLVPSFVPFCCSLRFSSSFALSFDKRSGEVSCGVRPRVGLSLVLSFAVSWGVVSCPYGVLSFRVVLAVRVLLCSLCGLAVCLPFLWYIGIINWLYISFDWIFDMPGLPAATEIGFECLQIDNAILIELKAGALPILEPDKAIKYAGLAASRIADFVLANDYRIPDYLKAADFLDDGNPRLARAIRFVVDSLRVP